MPMLVGMKSPRGSARWCRSCMKCWCCDYVGDNIGCWAIMVVMVVIEMVVDDKEVYKVGKVVTKVRTKAKSAETGFFSLF